MSLTALAKRMSVVIPIVSAVVVSACSNTPELSRISLLTPDGGEKEYLIELADTPIEWARGLMGRKEVTNGMLFVFYKPQVLSFWMKDTLVPLDIVFFDAEGGFVSSATMEPCKQADCPDTISPSPALYALEMPAGFLEQESVGEGWRLGLPLKP